ncbi:MAG: enoyl-CoA hydratase-related protein [Polyangiales bacterium]
MLRFPETTTLLLHETDGVVGVTLNRPERKNALSPTLIEELIQVFGFLAEQRGLRAIVLRGAGHTFCAGADIKEMKQPGAADPETRKREIARGNRRIGELLLAVETIATPVVAVIEGAVLGGGLGLVCVSDVALAAHDARFGLPETGLGLVPAQIAPFVVQRLGFTQARRLMLTGARLSAADASQLGLVHAVFPDSAQLEAGLARVLSDIRRCAPEANARTKRLLFSVSSRELGGLLDEAAQVFAEASVSGEAQEGTQAFVEKRPPRWSV